MLSNPAIGRAILYKYAQGVSRAIFYKVWICNLFFRTCRLNCTLWVPLMKKLSIVSIVYCLINPMAYEKI